MNKQIQFRIVVAVLCFLAIITRMFSQQNQDALLWEISGKGLKSPSYIFGTYHLMCPDQILVTDGIKNAIKQSKQVYLELDFDDQVAMQKIQTSMLLPPGQRLGQFCTAADSALIDTFLQKNLGATFGQLSGVKPIVLLPLIYMPLMGCQPESWERRLVAVAAEQQKEVLGLETVEFQMGIFDNIPNQKQIGWIVEYLKHPDQTQTEFDGIMKAYKQQQVDFLTDMIAQSPQFREYTESLLYNRNRNWANKIPEIIRQQPTFFAVGAGHLGGQQGVLALLRAQGYTVKPVK